MDETIADGIAFWKRGWALSFADYDQEPSGLVDICEGYWQGVLEWDPSVKRRTRAVVRWVLKIDGKAGSSGRITFTRSIRSRGTPGRMIYQGTDSFWNVCIQGSGGKIRSKNGRLYCWKPGTSTRYATAVSSK